MVKYWEMVLIENELVGRRNICFENQYLSSHLMVCDLVVESI